MRCKGNGHVLPTGIAQLFLDLRGMAVCRYTVCLHILIDFTEKVLYLCPSARAGCTGLSIYDQGVVIDQPLFDKWISRQNGTGRITARIGYQTHTLHLVAVDLTQTVNRFLYKLWALVCDAIPLLISSDIFDAVVCAQIYDLNLTQDLLCQYGCQITLRCCRKDHIHLSCQFLQIIVQTGCIHNIKHITIDMCIFLVHIRTGTIPHNLYFFMS